MKGEINLVWNFKGDRPIYSQIVDTIKIFIISGRLSPGEKLPAVRELASQAGVNPNTMQRALAELERLSLVYTSRTSGRFVTGDDELIKREKQTVAKVKITEFLSQMESIGFTKDEIVKILNESDTERTESI